MALDRTLMRSAPHTMVARQADVRARKEYEHR